MMSIASDQDGYRLQDVWDQMKVSRETQDRIRTVIDVLDKWRVSHNLVGPQEREYLIRRHILDSLQLWNHRDDDGANWIDLGSGAGFPALILACAGAETGDHFTLVESTGKKSAYLRYAARSAGLPVTVLNERIENVSRETYKHVTARALAPLPRLLEHANGFLDEDANCIFLKGKDVNREIELAQKAWSFDYDLLPSLSHPDGRILIVRELDRRDA